MANPQYLTLISQQIIGKLLLMDSTGATVLLVYSTGTVAIMPNLLLLFFFSNRFVFFFFLKYLCKLAYILLY